MPVLCVPVHANGLLQSQQTAMFWFGLREYFTVPCVRPSDRKLERSKNRIERALGVKNRGPSLYPPPPAPQGADKNRQRCHQALRAVLLSLRDRLNPDEAADLAAQLPVLVTESTTRVSGQPVTGAPVRPASWGA